MERQRESEEMEEENGGVSGFSLLPEGCVSDIVSLTSPRDACRASAVSCGLKSAADSDAVWGRFLPPDYEEIISRSVTPVVCSTKKELYFLLCNTPLLLDGGTMSFMLNKSSGKKIYMLPARELSIAWKDTPRYWKWKPLPESRFAEVAELVSVCWLDIRGRMGTRMLSPKTTYAAYLVFKLAENYNGLEIPMKSSVRLNGHGGDEAENETSETSTVYLKSPPPARHQARHQNEDRQGHGHGRLPQEREDGWMEIELGEFFTDEGDDGDVEMRFMEIQVLWWKSGLIVQGIELRPK